MRTTTEYTSGKLRIVETRTEIIVSESVRTNVLGLKRHSWEIDPKPMRYISVSLAYHLNDDRCIEGKFVFEEEDGKQWKLFVPNQKVLSFPKQSVMTNFVRKNFA